MKTENKHIKKKKTIKQNKHIILNDMQHNPSTYTRIEKQNKINCVNKLKGNKKRLHCYSCKYYSYIIGFAARGINIIAPGINCKWRHKVLVQ